MAGVPVAAERGRTPRIAALDALRGIALLGILLMNIIGFALPKAAYLNPAYQGIPRSGIRGMAAAQSGGAG